MLSIVIPTLNAAATLAPALQAVSRANADIVVCDGGSTDGTVELAESLGARTLSCPPGRGRQLNAGAAAARGDWLLFLHADTVLAPGWLGAARVFMVTPGARVRAAAFTLRFDDATPEARRVESWANWRARFLGLPYGDQGLLISRSLFNHLGGYKPLALMEDVDMVKRVGRSFINVLAIEAVTSAERYQRDGWWARPLRNLTCLALYHLGVSPEKLVDIYTR